MLVIGTQPLKYVFYNFMGMKDVLDCIIISSQIKDGEDQTETQELKETMSELIQTINHSVHL
jgi:hypothetical protein